MNKNQAKTAFDEGDTAAVAVDVTYVLFVLGDREGDAQWLGSGTPPGRRPPAGGRQRGSACRTRLEADDQRTMLPDTWQVIHVADRLEEAFQTLGRLPARIWPKQFGNAMPAVVHDYADRIAQLETGEFFREMRDRNIVRRMLNRREFKRMEQALALPLLYLRDNEELARTVCLGHTWPMRAWTCARRPRKRGRLRFPAQENGGAHGDRRGARACAVT